MLATAFSAPLDSVVDVTEDTLGNYRFAFNSGDYSKVEERTQDGSTKGKFSFVDPDGVKHTIQYQAAAEQGVQATGADIPRPVPDTPENESARNQFLAVYSAIQNDPRFAESPHDDDESPISPEEYLAALHEQVEPSAPLVFQGDTPDVLAAKYALLNAHAVAVGN